MGYARQVKIVKRKVGAINGTKKKKRRKIKKTRL